MNLKSEKISEKREEFKEILGTFVRPRRITEEEVTYHKEQKICLVCKGKVSGYNNYICKCDTLYCEKCGKTLEDLENACWVCSTPFNALKPSRPFDYEEKMDIVKTE